MSASQPIVLVDDDSSVEEGGAKVAAVKRPSGEEEALDTFVAVTGWNKTDALKAVEQAGFNVQLAISRVFDGKDDHAEECSQPRVEQNGSGDVAESRLNFDAEDSKETGRKTDHDGTLHPKWHERVGLVREMGEGPFVDPEFPPTASSLDGRQHRASTSTSQGSHEPQKRVLCTCGLPAAARRVQSDGPNYGRFYLACGRPRGRYTRRSPNDDNEKRPANPYQSKPVQNKPCNFFQWDHDGSLGANYSDSWSRLGWYHFGPENGCVLYRKHIGPDQVRQGSIGNCWFLSALSVVAEKPYLVKQLLPHATLNDSGCYQVNLCLGGKWNPVIVDSSLPVLFSEVKTATNKNSKHVFKGGVIVNDKKELVAYPAFAATPEGQLWPALVEKAYAKAHGSYAQLSGGFIAEALFDLTGSPTETILLGMRDKDELWARLLSFSEAGFLMGVATSQGGNGLVGGHAYSVLQIIEQHDAVVGEQQKVTDFFSASRTSGKKRKVSPQNDEEVVVIPNPKDEQPRNRDKSRERTTIRLVRIRNPWGKKEWKGEWSANSEQWTRALRKRIGDDSFAEGDGTFFMSLDDMVERFHHMDVAKCRQGWIHASHDSVFDIAGCDPVESSHDAFLFNVSTRTWAFFSMVQPKKRANTRNQYWYCDLSMVILKRSSPSEEWVCEISNIQGVSRTCDSEIFLDPKFEYCCVPFSCCGGTMGASKVQFRLTSYSSGAISVTRKPRSFVSNAESLEILHKELLRKSHKLQYVVAPKCVLVCVHGQGCLYFVAINASSTHYLLMKLVVVPRKGLLLSGGRNDEAHDVPPRTQKILLIVSTDGKFSESTSVSFTYASDFVAANESGARANSVIGIRNHVDINMAGDLLAGPVNPGSTCNKGSDTVDTQNWIGMLGASC